MKRVFVALLFVLALSLTGFGQSLPPTIHREADGLPKVTSPSEIIWPNTSLSRSGQKLTVTFTGGVGTVTSVSVVTANGLSGTVATATTTPAITLNISALDATKIADGTVTSAEFQFINSLTSNAQSQIDLKAPLATPVFTTNITSPLVIGGAAVGSSLDLRSTSAVGTTDFVRVTVGSNGATEAARFLTNGNVGFGVTAPSTLGGRVLEILGSTDNKLGGFIVTSTGAGVTTKTRLGSNFDGGKFTQNATYNNSAWVADDTGKATSSILVNASVADGFIQFFTSSTNDAGIGTERVRINKLGVTNFFKGADVASAAAIVPTGNSFHVTGTTTITSITSTGIIAGTTITIIFDGVLTFTDGSNLKLAGNFVTTADDVITLTFDGTNWFENTRAVN